MAYRNKKSLLSKAFEMILLGSLVILGLSAIGGIIYLKYLYAAGEISPEDYARISGRVPTMVIVR